MAININLAIRTAHKGASIMRAAAAAKYDIADTRAKGAMADRLNTDPNSYQYDLVEMRCTLWLNYCAACKYNMQFFKGGTTEYGGGVKENLEDMWVNGLGNSIGVLNNIWNDYKTPNIKTPLAFENKPGPAMDTYETEFTGNKSEIIGEAGEGFLGLFEEMFDLFVNDIWAAEGMRRWLDNQLNRGPVDPGLLQDWDDLVEGSRQFFVRAQECMAKIANEYTWYYDNKRNAHGERELQYTWGPANRYYARGGLYKADAQQLTAPQRNTLWILENKKVTVR